jgi:ribosomal protein L4
MMKKLPAGRKYLIFVNELDEVLERAAANIGNVTLLQVQRLNMVDLMKHDKVVFYKDASEAFQKTFLPISQ